MDAFQLSSDRNRVQSCFVCFYPVNPVHPVESFIFAGSPVSVRPGRDVPVFLLSNFQEPNSTHEEKSVLPILFILLILSKFRD